MKEFSEDQRKDLEAIGKLLLKMKEGEATVVTAFGKVIAISCIKKDEAEIKKCRVRTHREYY